MEKNKICPYCGALIADDSFYCDQCGKQLFICPNCHEYGKGKFCKHCGSPMQVVCDDILEVVSTAISEVPASIDPDVPQASTSPTDTAPTLGTSVAEAVVNEVVPVENVEADTSPTNAVDSNQKESHSPVANLPKLTIKL